MSVSTATDSSTSPALPPSIFWNLRTPWSHSSMILSSTNPDGTCTAPHGDAIPSDRNSRPTSSGHSAFSSSRSLCQNPSPRFRVGHAPSLSTWSIVPHPANHRRRPPQRSTSNMRSHLAPIASAPRLPSGSSISVMLSITIQGMPGDHSSCASMPRTQTGRSSRNFQTGRPSSAASEKTPHSGRFPSPPPQQQATSADDVATATHCQHQSRSVSMNRSRGKPSEPSLQGAPSISESSRSDQSAGVLLVENVLTAWSSSHPWDIDRAPRRKYSTASRRICSVRILNSTSNSSCSTTCGDGKLNSTSAKRKRCLGLARRK